MQRKQLHGLDQNALNREGDLQPLWRVLRYAHNQQVHEMRENFIDSGAPNGEVELERLEKRLNIDPYEQNFMRDYRRPTVLFIYLLCMQVSLFDRGIKLFLLVRNEMAPHMPNQLDQATT